MDEIRTDNGTQYVRNKELVVGMNGNTVEVVIRVEKPMTGEELKAFAEEVEKFRAKYTH